MATVGVAVKMSTCAWVDFDSNRLWPVVTLYEAFGFHWYRRALRTERHCAPPAARRGR